MKKFKYHRKPEFHYECMNCDNEFSRDYPVNPTICFDCHAEDSFEEEITHTEQIEQFCPICETYFDTSDYLNEVFQNNERARWLANMVMHYRHDHQTSWNKQCGRHGHHYCQRIPNYNYDEQKKLYNERGKRQIIRKATDFLNKEGFTPEDFQKLQHTTEKTMTLARKKLQKVKPAESVLRA